MNFKPIVRIESPRPRSLEKASNKVKRILSNDNFWLVNKKEVYIKSLLHMYQGYNGNSLDWELWAKLPIAAFIGISKNMSGYKHLMNAHLITPILLYKDTVNLEICLEFELKEQVKPPKSYHLK